MKAIIIPIVLGLAAYVASAIGLWFMLPSLLLPAMPGLIWLLPAIITLVPLFISGYVSARVTVSSYRARRVAFGIIVALIGYGATMLITQAQIEAWVFVFFVLGAAIVAAAGGLLVTRKENAF